MMLAFRLAALEAALARSPVVAVLGPRQCGKTTLARKLAIEKDQAAASWINSGRWG